MGASGLCVACVLTVKGCAGVSSSAVGAGDGTALAGLAAERRVSYS